MKRNLAVCLAALLVLTLVGQAAAYFEEGHLIRVVYDKAGAGKEVATDLIDVTGWKTAASFPINQVVGGGEAAWDLSMFPGKALADLNVQYYAVINTGKDSWNSGPETGQTARYKGFSSYNGAATIVRNYYQTLAVTAGTVVGNNSELNSYWNLMDKNGVGIGSFSNWIVAGWGHANLADLATVGYVDQTLYFYDQDVQNNYGLNVAVLRTMADGSTIINPTSGPVVPVPAAAWLLGSGLIALVGIRRRMN